VVAAASALAACAALLSHAPQPGPQPEPRVAPDRAALVAALEAQARADTTARHWGLNPEARSSGGSGAGSARP
jgi:hypothetical protein